MKIKEIIVINKPSGLIVHPGAGNKNNTLVNGLINILQKNLSNLNGEFRPGIVHRIDKDTSGLLLWQKTIVHILIYLNSLLNIVLKEKYIALIWGVINFTSEKYQL